MEAEPQAPSAADREELAIVEASLATPQPAKPRRPGGHSSVLTPEQWQEAEAMYLTGSTPAQIAKHYGIAPRQVTMKATRGGWAPRRNQLTTAAQKLAEGQAAPQLTLIKNRVLESTAIMVDEGIQILKKTPPRNRREVREHFGAIQSVLEVAKPVLGIGAEQQGGKAPLTLQFLCAPGQIVRRISPPAIEIPSQAA